MGNAQQGKSGEESRLAVTATAGLSETIVVHQLTELHSLVQRKEWDLLMDSYNYYNNGGGGGGSSKKYEKFKKLCRTWLQDSSSTLTLPIHLALRDDSCPLEVIEFIISAFPECLALSDESSDGMLPLHWACWARQNDDVISCLCEQYREAAHTADKFGRLPIHIACEYGVPSSCGAEVINVLLHANPMSIQSLNADGKTPLDIVMENSEREDDDNYAPRQPHLIMADDDNNSYLTGDRGCARAEVIAPLLQKKQLLQHSHSLATDNSTREYNGNANSSSQTRVHKTRQLNRQGSSSDLLQWSPSTLSVRKKLSNAHRESIKLHELIEDRNWEEALMRIKNRPADVVVWYSSSSKNYEPNDNIVPHVGKNKPEMIINNSMAQHMFLPIHRSCRQHSPNLNLVRSLLKEYPDGIGCRDSDGMLPLHWASYSCCNKKIASNEESFGANSVDLVKFLINLFPGAVAIKDKFGRLPIHIVSQSLNKASATEISNEAKEVFRILLQRDPQCLDVEDREGLRPGQVAENLSFDLFDERDQSMHNEQQFDDVTNMTNGNRNLASSSIEAIIKQAESHRSLSSSDASCNKTNNNKNLGAKKESAFRKILSKNENNVSNKSDFSSTAATTLSPSISTVASEITSASGKSELYRSIESRSWNQAEARLSSNVEEAHLWYYSGKHKTKKYLPLHRACKATPPVSIIQMLVRAYPQALELEANRGWLPLHYACAYHASFTVIEFLVKAYPSSLHIREGKGGTPLDIAQYYYQGPYKVAIVDLLKKDPNSFCESNSSNEYSLTPIQEVELSSSDQSIKVRVQLRSPSPLLDGRNCDKNSCIAGSSDLCPIDQTNDIISLIEQKDWNEVMLCIEINPDKVRKWNMQYDDNDLCLVKQLPIHAALMQNPPIEVIESLVKLFPAGLRMKDHAGRLPLHWACECGASSEVIETLLYSFPLSAGAVDNANLIPLNCAENSNNPSRVAIMTYMMMNAQMKDSESGLTGYRSEGGNSDWETTSSREDSLSFTGSTVMSQLFVYIEAKDWHNVINHLRLYTDEATLGCCKEGSFAAITILPLHRACQLRPPEQAISALIQAAPQALRFVGENDMLPIHYACLHDASKHVISLLLEAFPSSISVKANGETPLQVAERSLSAGGSDSSKKDIIEMLTQHNSSNCIPEVAGSFVEYSASMGLSTCT